MKSFGLACFIIFIAFSVWLFAGVKPMERNTEYNMKINRIDELDEPEKLEFINNLCKERLALKSALIRQLDSANTNDGKFAAAFLLGYYRMEQSVRSLSNYITLENVQRALHEKQPLWGRWPIVEALIRIGRPAIPTMIENIETGDDQKVRENSTIVIRYVEGYDIGRYILEKAIEEQENKIKKNNLKLALKYYEKLSPPVIEPNTSEISKTKSD